MKSCHSFPESASSDGACLGAADPEVMAAIDAEYARQTETLEMIASENFAPPAVLEAQGSILTNKYAEGYPGKRYYGGCANVDTVERLAIERACRLFGAEAANVQPNAGSAANMAAYFALVEFGDPVMGMDLDAGGHLTHGAKVNFSGKYYRHRGYGLNPQTELLDYDALAAAAREHKPKLIMAGYSAYPRILDFARFREIANDVGAYLVVDMAHFAGLVAGGCYPNPAPFADLVTSTTHKTLRGPRSGFVVGKQEFIKKVDRVVFPGIQGGPLMHTIAAKAVTFKLAMAPAFQRYARQICLNARTLGEQLKSEGLRLVTGGTDNHLLLVDLTSFSITGAQAQELLEQAGVTVNKNKIPFDKRIATETSGVRIGTPALTTRGMKEAEMKTIGGWIGEALRHGQDASVLSRIRGQVQELCRQFPLFKE
ncbi:MAG: serine hydroxymethyltransferase [Candidatus Sumerlaeota bacterium]|nr:serine hydroxymethyltransferase [Candidatus Sumerlaeota bacterium]